MIFPMTMATMLTTSCSSTEVLSFLIHCLQTIMCHRLAMNVQPITCHRLPKFRPDLTAKVRQDKTPAWTSIRNPSWLPTRTWNSMSLTSTASLTRMLPAMGTSSRLPWGTHRLSLKDELSALSELPEDAAVDAADGAEPVYPDLAGTHYYIDRRSHVPMLG